MGTKYLQPSGPTPLELAAYRVPVFTPKTEVNNTVQSVVRSLLPMLQNNLDLLCQRDPAISRMVACLASERAKAVVFGGWVRDHIVSHIRRQVRVPRDIDFVVDGISTARLRDFLPEGATQNVFGGFTTKTDSFSLDVWPLAETYLIRKKHLPPVFETLPQTTVFRINSITFSPWPLWTGPSLTDAGAFDAITQGVIDFRSDEVPLPRVQVARAVIYGAKLGFRLHPEVVAFIHEVCSSSEVVAEVIIGIKKFCPDPYLQEAIALLDRLVHQG